jgi:hypothetical protein
MAEILFMCILILLGIWMIFRGYKGITTMYFVGFDRHSGKKIEYVGPEAVYWGGGMLVIGIFFIVVTFSFILKTL